MDRDYEIQRRQLWIDVAVMVGGSSNCVKETSMKTFANYALKEFDKIFKEEDKDNE